MKKLIFSMIVSLGLMGLTACTTGGDAGMKCQSGKCETGKKCQASGKCNGKKVAKKCQASGKCGK